MPLTRSQATRNTRSTSRATLSLGIQGTRGKNVASESKSRKALTQAQPEDRLTIKMLEVLTEIFWWIIGKYCSKVFKIILRQSPSVFRSLCLVATMKRVLKIMPRWRYLLLLILPDYDSFSSLTHQTSCVRSNHSVEIKTIKVTH